MGHGRRLSLFRFVIMVSWVFTSIHAKAQGP
jgi:hypothetical protein